MKNAIIIFLSFAAPMLVKAQGSIYTSNLGNSPSGSAAIGANSWVAQQFVWAGHTVNGVEMNPDLTLNAVQLLLAQSSGSPADFAVSLYSGGSSGAPGNNLGNLIGSSDPSTPGTYTYTTAGITLSPSLAYFVVVRGATPVAQGAYNWSTTASLTQTGNGSYYSYLGITDIYYTSVDVGATWNYHFRQDIFQMAIYGTPVPEPSALALGCCGGLLLAVRWLRVRRH